MMSFRWRPLYTLLTLGLLLCAVLLLSGLIVTATSESAVLAVPAPDSLAASMSSTWPMGEDHRPSVVTTSNGAFQFTGLERGTHQVYVDLSSLPGAVGPISEGDSVVLWLNPGQSLVSDVVGNNVRFAATYHSAGNIIDGVVFVDHDQDGHHDPGEAGLGGVTVVDPNVHQYYVPFDDQDLIELLRASNACQGQQLTIPVGDTIASRISLTASSNDTIFFYDHWEDGYDVDPLDPGPTTEVGVLNAGETHIFEADVNTADVNWGTTLYYDGRDRITIFGEPASVIRGASPSLQDSAIGTRLAGAWEIDEVANWGTEYVVPAGEDWGARSDFEFTGATVTALEAGTQLFYNGGLAASLSPEAPVYFAGVGDGSGLQSGDTFTATAPIQVHAYSSICDLADVFNGNPWSGNGYTLVPLSQWTSDYWSPVPRRTAGPSCNLSADTDIFLYNATGSPFDIVVDDGGVPTTVLLPAGRSSLIALNGPLSDIRGAHVYAPGGQPFWGVVNFNTLNIRFEWGYSLIPADELSSQVVLGWAPGNDYAVPLLQYPPNGNLAFVTPVTDTVVFADFDQDGNADLMDCNGDGDAADIVPLTASVCDEPGSDIGVTVQQGETLRVADPIDADMTGARIFTRDLTKKLAVAWGQDSCVADGPLPYIDMGYTVLPIAVPSVSKADTLVIDVDQSGDTSPGDVLEYTIVIANNGQGLMSNVVLTDFVPYTHTNYVVGSIGAVSSPPALPAPTQDFYDGASWGYTPVGAGAFNVDPIVQQFRLGWAQIDAGQLVTVTFRVRIQTDIPPNVRNISNVALVGSDQTEPRESEDPDDPDPRDPDTDTELGQPILWLDKLPSDPSVVAPGDFLTYTIVVSNVGTATALSALVVDVLPPWMTYVPNTLDLTWPVGEAITTTSIVTYLSTFEETYGDNFDNSAHTLAVWPGGNDGTLGWTVPISDWIELGDDGNPNLGDIQVVSAVANSPPGRLQLTDSDGVESGVMRCVDLSSFVEPHLTFQMQGDADNTSVDDAYRVEISGTTSIASVVTQDARTNYEVEDIDLVAFAGDSSVCVSFFAELGMDPTDAYSIDDIFVYENSPDRTEARPETEVTSVIHYFSVSDTDPVTYTRILPDPFTTAITHTMHITDEFPFPPQSLFTASFQMRVGYPLTDGLVMVNTASITATNLLTKPYPLTDDEPTQVQSDHVLTISKASDRAQAFPGELLTYTLGWEVAGDEPAPGVVVTDYLPLPYVSFVSCAPLPACQGETVQGSGIVLWNLGDRLPPMSGITFDSGVLTLTVRIDQAPPAGIFTNTTIIDDSTDTPTDSDDETTIVPNASYELDKRRLTPSPVNIGEDVAFSILITNTGALTITQLPLEDTYDPVYLEFRDATPAEDSAEPGLITWNDLTVHLPGFGSVLPPGESVQVTVRFVALTSTQLLNPPVTINQAVSAGAQTDIGELPRREDQDDVEVRDSTAIELLYFAAKPKAGGVLVEWVTLFEIDTFGFRLFRSRDVEFSGATSVAFIGAKGWGGLGAGYQYLDADLVEGSYYYWLVEVETGGRETVYGPVNARSGWTQADLPYRIYLPLLKQQ